MQTSHKTQVMTTLSGLMSHDWLKDVQSNFLGVVQTGLLRNALESAELK